MAVLHVEKSVRVVEREIYMYNLLYLYPVLKDKKDRFIELNKKAALIYKEYGAIEDDTFQPTLIGAVYGCKGMEASVELHENETLNKNTFLFALTGTLT